MRTMRQEHETPHIWDSHKGKDETHLFNMRR